MLAHLQKIITYGVLLASLGVGWFFVGYGSTPVAFVAGLLFLLFCLGVYAGALAVEFGLATFINSRSGCAVASWRQCVAAWWNEVTIAPVLFCWRQPFRENAFADQLGTFTIGQGQQGVVFVHGFFCNRAFWSPWMARLENTGRVYVAVSLEPVFGSIDDYSPAIDNAVRNVMASTGVLPLLVCHSMGGLAVRAWLAQQPADGPTHHIVTIGTPHRGTWLARWGQSTNARQMQVDSDWLNRLNSLQARLPPHRFTCWYSNADNIVFPSSSATLPGADNRELQAVAHVQMAFLPQVIDETLLMLENRSL